MKTELKHKFEEEYIDADPYAKAILDVARKTMEIIDKEPQQEIDANELIRQADKELDEGITGNMAGYIAVLVSKYHERGDEFKKSWNKHWGNETAKGIINPAIITLKD